MRKVLGWTLLVAGVLVAVWKFGWLDTIIAKFKK